MAQKCYTHESHKRCLEPSPLVFDFWWLHSNKTSYGGQNRLRNCKTQIDWSTTGNTQVVFLHYTVLNFFLSMVWNAIPYSQYKSFEKYLQFLLLNSTWRTCSVSLESSTNLRHFFISTSDWEELVSPFENRTENFLFASTVCILVQFFFLLISRLFSWNFSGWIIFEQRQTEPYKKLKFCKYCITDITYFTGLNLFKLCEVEVKLLFHVTKNGHENWA